MRTRTFPLLCYLLGVMVGDGCVYISKDHSQTEFVSSSNKNFVLYIAEIVKSLGISVRIKKHHKFQCWYAVNYRKNVAKTFKKMLQNINLLIVVFPRECQLAFVEGIIDAEGSIFTKKYKRKKKIYNYQVVEIKMKSRPVLETVSRILEKVGIKHSFYYDNYNAQWKLKIEGRNSKNLKSFCKFSYKLNSTIPSSRRAKPA